MLDFICIHGCGMLDSRQPGMVQNNLHQEVIGDAYYLVIKQIILSSETWPILLALKIPDFYVHRRV